MSWVYFSNNHVSLVDQIQRRINSDRRGHEIFRCSAGQVDPADEIGTWIVEEWHKRFLVLIPDVTVVIILLLLCYSTGLTDSQDVNVRLFRPGTILRDIGLGYVLRLVQCTFLLCDSRQICVPSNLISETLNCSLFCHSMVIVMGAHGILSEIALT